MLFVELTTGMTKNYLNYNLVKLPPQYALKHSCPQNKLGGSPSFKHVGHAIEAALPQPGVVHIVSTGSAGPTSTESLMPVSCFVSLAIVDTESDILTN